MTGSGRVAQLQPHFYRDPGPRLGQVGWIAIPLPPVQPSDEFAHLEPKRQEFQRRLRRRIAPDAVAVADVEFRLVPRGGRVGADLPVREADRACDVLVSIGTRGAAIDHDNGFTVLDGLVQIRGVRLLRQFALVVAKVGPCSRCLLRWVVRRGHSGYRRNTHFTP